MAEEKKEAAPEVEEKKSDVIAGTDVAPQKPTDPGTPPGVPPKGSPNRIDIDVDQATATAMKVQEFDKLIAEAEANVAELKKQKATYIYEANVQSLIQQAQQRKAAQPK